MSVAAITYKDLISNPRDLVYPCSVALSGNDEVQLTQALRVIPKKRITALGLWQGKQVIVKLFFSPRKAEYYAARDKQGIHRLLQASITTPALYYTAQTTLPQVYVLIFEYIPEANALRNLWEQAVDVGARTKLLIKIIRIVAKLHQSGLIQEDMHMNNFIFANARIYTLDGDAIKQVSSSENGVGLRDSLKNLAKLIAEMSFVHEVQHKNIYVAYCNFRHLIPKEQGFNLFKKYILQQVHYLKRKYLAKTQRNCSSFVAYQRWDIKAYWLRQQVSAKLPALLEDLTPTLTQQSTVEILDQEKTYTTMKWERPEQTLCIKYYPRSFLPLKPSYAKQAWLNYHYLNLLNIPTVNLFAFAKKGYCPMSSCNYLIGKYQAGLNLKEFIAQFESDPMLLVSVFNHIALTFKKMADFNLTYGYMQPEHFLVVNDKVLLTHFDTVKQHKHAAACYQQLEKELYHFMQNWHDQPHIAAIAITALKQQKLLG